MLSAATSQLWQTRGIVFLVLLLYGGPPAPISGKTLVMNGAINSTLLPGGPGSQKKADVEQIGISRGQALAPTHRIDPRVRIVLTIIEEHRGDLQQQVIAATDFLGLSEAHLHRLFKRQVGISMRRYIRNVKLTKAARLLERHCVPIKEIAAEAGYDDVSNFYRDFRQVHGTTPRCYRTDQLERQTSAPHSAFPLF